eukprot:354438-Prorocentrum_minimum.AAC.1
MGGARTGQWEGRPRQWGREPSLGGAERWRTCRELRERGSLKICLNINNGVYATSFDIEPSALSRSNTAVLGGVWVRANKR